MLSISATSPLSFAGTAAASWSRAAANIIMNEPPPVFSEVDEDVRGYYRTPSETSEAFNPNTFVQTLPGITAPLGFFDPAGFCSEDGASNDSVTEGKVRFYREVEIKHCRVAMLAALGYPLAEVFHPLWGGKIDGLSFDAFQQTPLQTFWPAVLVAIAIPEVFSVFSFQNPASRLEDGSPAQPWTIRSDHEAGDLGWDPLGLKPEDPAELLAMQNKELNNGR